MGGNVMRYQYKEWYADKLKSAMQTPATDSFLAEVRAQGVEMFSNAIGVSYQKLKPGSAQAKALKNVVFLAVHFAA